MLKPIQSYAQSYAEIILKVTGIDVEIVDANMLRIAGTGIYAAGVDTSLDKAGEVYREVMRTRQTVLIESPRCHTICQRCPDREQCQEHLSLSTPIISEDAIFGVIGLVCFNEQDRVRVLESRDSYTAFIALLADALAHKVKEHRHLHQVTNVLDMLLNLVNPNQQGIIIFDAQGLPTYVSTLAREWLGEEETAQLRLSNLHRTGDSLSDMEEFELSLAEGSNVVIMGHMSHAASGADAEKFTLFSFYLPTGLAQRVGHLSAGGGETGFNELIGSSSAMMAVKEKATKVALSTSTVLITGESGTGKELMARAIHQAGARRDAPFVAINCGAIPEALLESELFGYVSGAFTGASDKGRMGRFELAQGGIIFLDEIGTMPLYLQVKLLRVLQERTITRLGSNRLVNIDVRIISATNEDLWACTQQNTFREDLYYRLNVIQLNMPPLRERHGDIPVLAEYFLNKYCTLFQKHKPALSSAVLSCLEDYPWAGNVRELEHVIEYAVNMMPHGGPLRLDCLPQRLTSKDVLTPSSTASPQSSEVYVYRPEPLKLMEQRAIEEALAHFGNHTKGKKEAAAALGLSVATLYRKLQEFSK